MMIITISYVAPISAIDALVTLAQHLTSDKCTIVILIIVTTLMDNMKMK